MRTAAADDRRRRPTLPRRCRRPPPPPCRWSRRRPRSSGRHRRPISSSWKSLANGSRRRRPRTENRSRRSPTPRRAVGRWSRGVGDRDQVGPRHIGHHRLAVVIELVRRAVAGGDDAQLVGLLHRHVIHEAVIERLAVERGALIGRDCGELDVLSAASLALAAFRMSSAFGSNSGAAGVAGLCAGVAASCAMAAGAAARMRRLRRTRLLAVSALELFLTLTARK